jgi:hypothetical protein
VYVLTREALREEPKITHVAFARLLAWLDDGVDSSGERYLEMRRRLVSYFDRRNRPTADELADDPQSHRQDPRANGRDCDEAAGAILLRGREKIERRRELASRLGITMNALGIRAFRLRDGLMACVETCRQRRRKI